MLCITPLYLGLFSIWTSQPITLRSMRLSRGTGQRIICTDIGSFAVGSSFVLNSVGPLPRVASQEKGLNLRPCMNIFLINMVFKVSPKSSQNRLQNDRPLQFPWNGGWVHFRRHGKQKFQRLYFFVKTHFIWCMTEQHFLASSLRYQRLQELLWLVDFPTCANIIKWCIETYVLPWGSVAQIHLAYEKLSRACKHDFEKQI